jgi:zinc finger protein 830
MYRPQNKVITTSTTGSDPVSEDKPKGILKKKSCIKKGDTGHGDALPDEQAKDGETKKGREQEDGGEEEDEEEEEEEDMEIDTISSSRVPQMVEGLPKDFFDTNPGSEPKAEPDAKPNPGQSSVTPKVEEELPKGFFDNPVEDAKARHVPYKDPMDEEWEKFQKAISTESQFSQNLVEEELEEIQTERNIEEIEEQISSWAKIEMLQKKAEELAASIAQGEAVKRMETENQGEEGEGDDDLEEDLDMFADWRKKGTVTRKR